MESSQKEGSQVPEAESHRDILKPVFHFGKLIDALRVDLIFLPKLWLLLLSSKGSRLYLHGCRDHTEFHSLLYPLCLALH